MENASKALIIAGAILLSILIIGLGMAVYNNASSSTSSANLDAQELSAHNSSFLAYEGKQKGTQVRSLLNAIKTNNAEYTDRMIGVGVSVNTDKAKPAEAKLGAQNDPNSANYSGWNTSVKSNTTYFVTFGYGANGCINSCEIHVYSDADLSGSNTTKGTGK